MPICAFLSLCVLMHVQPILSKELKYSTVSEQRKRKIIFLTIKAMPVELEKIALIFWKDWGESRIDDAERLTNKLDSNYAQLILNKEVRSRLRE